MQDRPTAVELLATIGEFLDQDILPEVSGGLRYRTLVALNLVSVLARELQAGDVPARREHQEMLALLGGPEPAGTSAPQDGTALQQSLLQLNDELQRRLMAPVLPDRAFLLDARHALERAVRDKLAINKPGYERYDMAAEVEARGDSGEAKG